MGWAFLLAISLFGAGANLVSNKALTLLPSPTVGVIGMLEIVLGGILGYLLFDEQVGWQLAAGACLIIGSSAWLTLSPGRSARAG